jgi:peptidylprolyl isomerase
MTKILMTFLPIVFFQCGKICNKIKFKNDWIKKSDFVIFVTPLLYLGVIMKMFKSLILSITLTISFLTATETTMKDRPIAVFEKTEGNFEVELRPDIAPKAVENFTGLAKKGYYDGVVFHRVIKGFMIQGGDPLGTGMGGSSIWGTPFEDEVSSSVRFDKPGLLAMANAGPKTNGSQFFITVAATPWLNGKHTIFGEVVKGYDIVQKIENTKTGPMDRPLEAQKILHITIKNQS